MDKITINRCGNVFDLTVGDHIVAYNPWYRSNIPNQRYVGRVTRILGSEKSPYCEVSFETPEKNIVFVKIDNRGDERGVSKGWCIDKYDWAKEQQLEHKRQEAILKDKLDAELYHALDDFSSRGRSVYINKCPEKTQELIKLLKEICRSVS